MRNSILLEIISVFVNLFPEIG